LSRVAKKRRENKRKKKAIIKSGIIFTIASGAVLAGVNSATALTYENNKIIETSNIENMSVTNKNNDLDELSESKDSNIRKKTIDDVVYKVEISDKLVDRPIESNKDLKIVEVDSELEKLKISGYINFNGEGDFVSPVDVFSGSKVSICDRINPSKIVTKENEQLLFSPLNISGTEVMIVDNNIYKLDIDEYSTIYYELIEDKATINLFKNQIKRANSSVSIVDEYNELQRVQSNINELELVGIDLEKYDIEALGMELDFGPVLLPETYSEKLGIVTAKYSGQMWYGDEVFIVTDNTNEIEGIYKIDNFNSSKLQKIKSSASIANILKKYEEKNLY
jgi:hypothetical protein